MKSFLPVFLICKAFLPSIHAYADGIPTGAVSAAKAAELALHRIENLVTRKKIDAGFLDRFSGLSLSVINPNATEGEIKFETVATQVRSADGSARKAVLHFDPGGFSIKYTQDIAAAAPVEYVNWHEKDPVTLCEGAMHVVLDEYELKPELRPFFEAFRELRIRPGKNSLGEMIAEISVTSEKSPATLIFSVKLNGDIEGFTIN